MTIIKKAIKWVAEIGSNHNQDLQHCFDFIVKAKEIGCDTVKFQLFKADKLWQSPDNAVMKKWELPVEFIPDISKHCKSMKIGFACTPFYLDAVPLLTPYISFFKIGSYEILWHKLIDACAMTKLPLVISTGMANNKEIRAAINRCTVWGNYDITLLHCVSKYPTKMKDCHLSFISSLSSLFNFPAGWSDHTRNPHVLYRTLERKTSIIEFHLDLDGKGNEYKFGHCWLPNEIEPVITTIKEEEENSKQYPDSLEREQRTDPTDGMRPMKGVR